MSFWKRTPKPKPAQAPRGYLGPEDVSPCPQCGMLRVKVWEFVDADFTKFEVVWKHLVQINTTMGETHSIVFRNSCIIPEKKQ